MCTHASPCTPRPSASPRLCPQSTGGPYRASAVGSWCGHSSPLGIFTQHGPQRWAGCIMVPVLQSGATVLRCPHPQDVQGGYHATGTWAVAKAGTATAKAQRAAASTATNNCFETARMARLQVETGWLLHSPVVTLPSATYHCRRRTAEHQALERRCAWQSRHNFLRQRCSSSPAACARPVDQYELPQA